jgi:hypothetical protein
VFKNLTGSNVDEKDEREVGRRLPFKWNWGLHFWMPTGRQEIESRIDESRFLGASII